MNKNPAKIILEFQKIPKLKQDKTFLEISGYPHYENVCSNILRFFLDPNNEHGLKDLFLNSLVKCIEPDFICDYTQENIEVTREFVTSQKNKLDLLIETGQYVIGIENKIFHFLANDLNDYSQSISAQCKLSEKKPIAIVLSLNHLTNQQDIEKIKVSGFKNITYTDLFENIKKSWGDYITTSNPKYEIFLKDFIKSIQNLIPRTMENKELRNFFKENAEDINELTAEFLNYRNSLFNKVNPLLHMLPKSEYAPNCIKQWIFKGEGGEVASCLVHDYLIDNKYRIAIDANIAISGWEITVFGRDSIVPGSNDYLINTLCRQKGFLPKPIDQYKINERIVYATFDTDAEIELVAGSLRDVLSRIEQYKTKTDSTILPT